MGCGLKCPRPGLEDPFTHGRILTTLELSYVFQLHVIRQRQRSLHLPFFPMPNGEELPKLLCWGVRHILPVDVLIFLFIEAKFTRT